MFPLQLMPVDGSMCLVTWILNHCEFKMKTGHFKQGYDVNLCVSCL